MQTRHMNRLLNSIRTINVAQLLDQEAVRLIPDMTGDVISKTEEMDNIWYLQLALVPTDGCQIPGNCFMGRNGILQKVVPQLQNLSSVMLIGMVDSQYRFISGSCDFHGNSHDAIIFQRADSWKTLGDGYIPENSFCFISWASCSCRLSHSLNLWANNAIRNALHTPK